MGSRLNPTLLDKLVVDLSLSGLREDEGVAPSAETGRQSLRYYSFANLDKFTEEALQANVRRELAWLLNTTNLDSAVKLTRYPQVRTSVLNYGVADLAGKAQSRTAVMARASKIREAVIAFEPRLDPDRLSVEVSSKSERENAVTYTITGDIAAAVQSIRVQYLTDIEVDTGAANVRE
jgi:type VI secretion system protein ImpF